MIDNTLKKTGYDSDSDFEKAFNESLKSYQENSIIKAKVVDISSDTVFLDFGYKSEAKIQTADFDVLPKVGEEIEIYLIMLEGRSGEPVVSKKRCDHIANKRELAKSWKTRNSVKGIVKEVKRGGFLVEYKTVYGFIPFNLFDFDNIDNPKQFLNKEIDFFIERTDFRDTFQKKQKPADKKDKKDRKPRVEEEFVGNRKRFLIDGNNKSRSNFFEEKKVGDVIEGRIKSITDFGAFINLGGVDGLLRIKDISWSRINKITDVLNENDTIKVQILSIDKENKKVTVGLKQLLSDPWDDFLNKYNAGDTVSGSVVSITTYGAFVKIIDGVEGLLHISDMSWIKKVKTPNEILSAGQKLELKIIKIDAESKKVSLSLKHLLENPWDNAKDKYKPGTIVNGKITSITTFGVFLELEEGIEALLHIDDYSWTENIRNPHDHFKVGDEIKAVVSQFDEKSLKIKVSMKDLSEDPWKFMKNYKSGDIIEVTVDSIEDDKGINVAVANDVKAFIPVPHLGIGKKEEIISALREDFKIGDKLKALVINVDFSKRRITLSVREYQKKIEHEKVELFLHSDNGEKYTLGDAMNSKESK